MDKPSLFAAKTSAVISRHWKNRIKGRDLFDFEWYINNETPINTTYLVNNLCREGLLNERSTTVDILEILKKRFESIDYDSALSDIRVYVDKKDIPQNWSPEHFIDLSKKIVFI